MSSGAADPGVGRLTPTPPPSVEVEEQSLLQSILRRRKRYVAVTTAVAVLATLVLTWSQTKTYSATSTVVVQAPPQQATAGGPNMATEAQIARSLAVAQKVARDLRLDVPPGELLTQLSVRVPADSDVLKLTYSSPVPETAQRRAQAFAKAFADVRRDQFHNDAVASAESITRQIQSMTVRGAKLSGRIERSDPSEQATLRIQRDALTTEIALLQQKLAEQNTQATTFSPASVLGSAALPESPTKPKLVLNLFLGLLGGLLLGFAIAAIAEYVDVRVRGASDLRRRLGVPVLGLIPKDDDASSVAGALTLVAIDAPSSSAADAYRRLRTNFIAAASHARTKSVAVMSVDHTDSSIELHANLAASLAAMGKRVVLVSTRQRHPALEELVGAAPGPGFLDALAGAVPLELTISDTGIENLLLCRAGSTETRDLGVASPSDDRRVAAIPSPARAHSLGSERTAALLEELAGRADFVLVDAPPLLSDADAASLARACDGVLAVATPSATREDISRSREQFERVGATVLGSVLVDPSHRTGKERDRAADSATAAEDEAERRMRLSSTNRRQSIALAKASDSAEMGEKG
jgi:capsular polysaccharide biosynthesis protein/Mrp family chromosome partitioning ATPase